MSSSATLRQPRIILGLMTFGRDTKAGGHITTLEVFNQCLDYFQEKGYSEVDTARMYLNGKQEEFTAEAGWKQRGLTIATKVYPSEPGFHAAETLRAKFTESLKALQTDSVDIFYLHAADRSVPFAETLEAVDVMYKEGKFRQLGLSNYTAFEVAEIVSWCHHRGWVRPTIYQAMYNAIIEKGPLPDEIVQVLDEAWLSVKGSATNYWHLDLEYTYDTQSVLFGKH